MEFQPSSDEEICLIRVLNMYVLKERLLKI